MDRRPSVYLGSGEWYRDFVDYYKFCSWRCAAHRRDGVQPEVGVPEAVEMISVALTSSAESNGMQYCPIPFDQQIMAGGRVVF
jgi:hypothetical protein